MNKPIRIAALCLLACLLSTGCVSKKLYNELAARHAEAVAENEALAAENQKNLSEAGRYRSLYQEASDQLEAARRQSAADREALEQLKRQYAKPGNFSPSSKPNRTASLRWRPNWPENRPT